MILTSHSLKIMNTPTSQNFGGKFLVVNQLHINSEFHVQQVHFVLQHFPRLIIVLHGQTH